MQRDRWGKGGNYKHKGHGQLVPMLPEVGDAQTDAVLNS